MQLFKKKDNKIEVFTEYDMQGLINMANEGKVCDSDGEMYYLANKFSHYIVGDISGEGNLNDDRNFLSSAISRMLLDEDPEANGKYLQDSLITEDIRVFDECGYGKNDPCHFSDRLERISGIKSTFGRYGDCSNCSNRPCERVPVEIVAHLGNEVAIYKKLITDTKNIAERTLITGDHESFLFFINRTYSEYLVKDGVIGAILDFDFSDYPSNSDKVKNRCRQLNEVAGGLVHAGHELKKKDGHINQMGIIACHVGMLIFSAFANESSSSKYSSWNVLKAAQTALKVFLGEVQVWSSSGELINITVPEKIIESTKKILDSK